MDYISGKNRKTLSNDPYILSIYELREMIRRNNLDIEETKHVTDLVKSGHDCNRNGMDVKRLKKEDCRTQIYKDILYQDRKTDGFIMTYPHGTVISQGSHNSYYRGEKQIYASSVPSLYRFFEGRSDEERILYGFVADMRVAEFQIFLNKLEIVQLWQREYGTVLYEPLAQHYGLETRWLDITSDLEVALFFCNM